MLLQPLNVQGNNCCQFIIIIIIITYLLTNLLTAIELSLGASSPYTSRDKTNKNKYTYTKQYT